MEWSNEDVLLLVDLVRRRPCLYDKECEAYHNTKLKQDVLKELASIISSNRPETTVDEVLEKWEALCSIYASNYKKGTAKTVRKSHYKHFFLERMGFMRSHLGLPIKNPVFKKNGSNEDTTDEGVTVNNGRLSQSQERYPCLELARIETSHSDVVSDEESNSVNATNGGSISAISIHSDNSPLVNSLPPQLNSSRKRRYSTMSITSQATLNQDVSCVTIGSPLVNVNDSILDRTEPFDHEYQTYRKSNGSFASKETYSQDEDEDHFYMRYILCKVKKLEGAQKLNFKLQLERLLYECTKK
ncbi:uncharacterized protein GBIM_19497 [Gryllus bimaculatus]|nr:uncharacterized protein GBIM_19497 [Gryllus bimaculatus]